MSVAHSYVPGAQQRPGTRTKRRQSGGRGQNPDIPSTPPSCTPAPSTGCREVLTWKHHQETLLSGEFPPPTHTHKGELCCFHFHLPTFWDKAVSPSTTSLSPLLHSTLLLGGTEMWKKHLGNPPGKGPLRLPLPPRLHRVRAKCPLPGLLPSEPRACSL